MLYFTRVLYFATIFATTFAVLPSGGNPPEEVHKHVVNATIT